MIPTQYPVYQNLRAIAESSECSDLTLWWDTQVAQRLDDELWRFSAGEAHMMNTQSPSLMAAFTWDNSIYGDSFWRDVSYVFEEGDWERLEGKIAFF